MLSVDSISFGYRGRRVFDALSLEVGPGRTILLGPNGAGKSTLLGLAASVLRGQQGQVMLNGVASRQAAYREQIAWMPQTVPTVSGLTVRQQVAFHGWLAGLSRAEAWSRAGRALAQVQLSDLADQRSTRISGGQRARMGLAQALTHDAGLLLLDEPTAALDPDQRHLFHDLLAEQASSRPSLILLVSSHDVSDLALTYDKVIVLIGGKVAFHDSTSAFLRDEDRLMGPVEAYRKVLANES